jgi:2',3'-cyclic-nucleotide 2'-phosphodiesterase/3'-nucleotidase
MSSLDLRHYLTEEIRREGSITPKSNNNWRFVPVSWAAPAIKRDRKKLFGK